MNRPDEEKNTLLKLNLCDDELKNFESLEEGSIVQNMAINWAKNSDGSLAKRYLGMPRQQFKYLNTRTWTIDKKEVFLNEPVEDRDVIMTLQPQFQQDYFNAPLDKKKAYLKTAREASISVLDELKNKLAFKQIG
jgi:hypothetical protein